MQALSTGHLCPQRRGAETSEIINDLIILGFSWNSARETGYSSEVSAENGLN
jgi:hypothetical protein